MSIFTLPEGFAEDKTAVLVPPECFEDFIEETRNQGYNVDSRHLLQWSNTKAKENHPVYFHFHKRRSIQAFCPSSVHYNQLKLVNYLELFPKTYTDILTLL